MREFQSLYILADTWLVTFLILAILIGLYYLIGILICIFLMICDVEYFFMSLTSYVYVLWLKNVLIKCCSF